MAELDDMIGVEDDEDEEEKRPKPQPTAPDTASRPPAPEVASPLMASPVGAPAMASTSTAPPAPALPEGVGAGQPAPPADPYGEYKRLAASKPGVAGVHGLPGVLAKIGDVAGSAFLPGVSAFIPGTTMHHQLLTNQALHAGQHETAADTAAETEMRAEQSAGEVGAERGATTAHLNAETTALQNPQPKPTEEEWNVVPGVQGPNGEPVQQEKHSGQVRVAPLQGASVTEKNQPKQSLDDQYDAAVKAGDQQRAQQILAEIKATKGAGREPKDTTGRDDARADRSYQFHSGQLEKLRTPIASRMERIGIAIDNLNQKSPQADALAAPEILTALVGGQGSGLRMNEAEISRIIGGATQWTQLKTALNKWSLDPQHATFTDEQRGQMAKILTTARDKITAKQQIIEDAEEKLANSTDPGEHRKLLADTRKKLDGIDAAGQQQGGGSGKLTVEEAQSYLQKAGGDKDKARQMAKADGRSF